MKTNDWRVIVDIEDCPEYDDGKCLHPKVSDGICDPDSCPRPNFHDLSHEEHQTAFIILDGEEVRVDREIAELILVLNERGLKTCNSCQGSNNKNEHHSKMAYIEFQPDLFESWVCRDGKLKVILRWWRPEQL